MRKITEVMHILRFIAGNTGKLPVNRQRGKPVGRTLFIGQSDDLLLKGEYGRIELRNRQHISGIDQVRIFDLRICRDDFGKPDLIFHGDLPHGIAGYHRILDASGGGNADAAYDDKYQNERKCFYEAFH